jgi:hypothetical protein
VTEQDVRSIVDDPDIKLGLVRARLGMVREATKDLRLDEPIDVATASMLARLYAEALDDIYGIVKTEP